MIYSAFRIFVPICLLLNLADPTYADERQRRMIEVTPWAGYVGGGSFKDKITGQDLDLDDGNSFGLNVNIAASHNTTYEIDYARQQTSTATPGLPDFDITIDKLEIGGTYELDSGSTRPYAAATAGVTRYDPDDASFGDDTYFSFSLGGGWKFLTDRRFGVTVDARWFGTFVDEDSDVFCLSAGGLTCLIQTDASVVSQFRVSVGLSARF